MRWRGNEKMGAASKSSMRRWFLAMPFAIFISTIHQMPSHASLKVFKVKMPTTNMAGIVINKTWYCSTIRATWMAASWSEGDAIKAAN